VLIVKLRRVTMAALVAAGVAAVTLMIDLVTNAASQQQRWPGWLSFVQRYPWQSFGLLAVAVVVLAAMLPAVSEPNRTAGPAAADQQDVAQQSVGSTAVLRTLPRDIAGFTNRQDEIEQILSDVAAAERILPVRTIDGMAGVGTSLAAALAEDGRTGESRQAYARAAEVFAAVGDVEAHRPLP
jgi:hypothetical protein